MNYFLSLWICFLSVCLYGQQLINPQSNNVYLLPNHLPLEHEKWSKKELLSKLNAQLPKDYKIVMMSSQTDELGYQHSRYIQYYKNILVENAMFIVHERNGSVYLANGGLYKINSTKSRPSLTRAKCLSLAKKYYNSSKLKSEAENPSIGDVVWCPINGDINKEFVLCYKFSLYSDVPLKKALVYVDASTGAIVWEHNKIHEVGVNGTAKTKFSGTQTFKIDSTSPTAFTLKDDTRGNGIFTKNLNNTTNYTGAVDFTNTSKNWIDTTNNKHAANDVHWGTQKVYDYYKNVHSRLSFDNKDGAIYSYAPYSNNYVNAFWDGTRMTYGYGNLASGFYPLTSLDVVGHEISHGVTTNTANLVYANESGALNESFSDVLGKSIERYVKPSTFSWTIGKEVTVAGDGIRSMSNPNLFQDPDTYQGTYWLSTNDVHINSGVQNFWYYILTDGNAGTNDLGNAYNVTGIGMSKSEKIAYRNLSVYLTPNSNYADARTYSIQAASDLYGSCSNELVQTANAWYAVGVGSTFSITAVPRFSALDSVICTYGDSLRLINTSVNAGSYLWDFGDGATSTLENPVHKYATPGTYTIKLKVWNCNATQSDSIIKTNYIIYDTTLTYCQKTPFVLNSKIVLNGCFYNLVDNGGSSNYANNSSDTIILSNPNVSKYKFTFNSFSTDPKDKISFYSGTNSFPDFVFSGNSVAGSSFMSDSNNVTIVFKSDNTMNSSGFNIRTICITNPPSAGFYSNTTAVCVDSVYFVNTSMDNSPNVSTYLWNFGDATTSTAKNPVHKYTTTGVYTVKLKTCNSIGCDSITKTAYISYNSNVNSCATKFGTSTSVKNLTNCNGYITDNGGTTGNYSSNSNAKIIMNNSSNVRYKLKFLQFKTDSSNDYIEIRDGNTASSPLIAKYTGKTLPNNGNDILTSGSKFYLNFVSNASIVDSGFIIKYTCVELPPKITDFTATDTQNCSGLFGLTPIIASTYTSLLWDFGDGTTSTSVYGNHTYANPGSYTVKLKVCNSAGCDSLTKVHYLTYDTSALFCASRIPSTGVDYIMSCDGLIVDNGGAFGNYSNNNDGAMVLSSPYGDAIKVRFLTQKIHSSDTLFIYENNIAKNLIGSYTGSTLANNGNDIMTNSSSLYFYFKSNSTLVDTGFVISYSCYTLKPKVTVDMPDTFSCNNQMTSYVISDFHPLLTKIDYGDGQKDSFTGFSNYIFHTYTQSGTYPITVVACNSMGCDTVIRHFEYDSSRYFCATRMPLDTIKSTIYNSCSGYITDAGGYKKNYVNNSNGSIDLVSFGGAYFSLRFITMKLKPKDTLYLYNISSTKTLIAAYSGNTLPNNGNPIDVQSGQLSFEFKSDTALVDSGFLIEYTCYMPSFVSVDFSVIDKVSCGGVQFNNFSQNAISYLWRFGDGDTSTASDPYHIYTSNGFYSPSLIACDNIKCDTLTKISYIEIQKPTAYFTAPDTMIVGAITINQSSVLSTSYMWYLDNVYKSASTQLRTSVSTAGKHTIRLIVSNSICSDTMSKIIYFKVGSGIETFDGINNARLFPNPTNGSLTLEMIQPGVINISAGIYDPQGRLIKHYSMHSTSGKLNEWMDLSTLANGQYYFKIQQEGSEKTIPFVIEK